MITSVDSPSMRVLVSPVRLRPLLEVYILVNRARETHLDRFDNELVESS